MEKAEIDKHLAECEQRLKDCKEEDWKRGSWVKELKQFLFTHSNHNSRRYREVETLLDEREKKWGKPY